FLAGMAVTLIPYALARRLVELPPAVPLAACVLLISGAISAMASTSPLENFFPALQFALALAGVTTAFALACVFSESPDLLILFWILGVGVNAAVAVTDNIGVTSIGTGITNLVFAGRAAGLTVHPNHLGAAAAM